MKTHLANYINSSRLKIGLLMILIAIIFLSGCSKESKSNSVVLNLDNYSLYPKIVEQILPTFMVEQTENKAYYTLEQGAIAEAYDTQAIGALETGIAKYWYPQFLATVTIAVDRDQTDALVQGWNDLLAINQEVAFFDTPGNVQMLTAAMSYGLEGKNYSLKKAIELLSSLHDKNLLKLNSFEAPIIICYDYQAATLIQNGHNLEIIVPIEGTFTYAKGLLSNTNLDFEDDIDKLLFSSKFRLLDGQSDISIYPTELEYTPAVRVVDYKHFAKTTQNATRLIERKVLNLKMFMSIDDAEHLYFALIYIIIVTIWASTVLRRSIQRGVGYAAIFTGIILNLWTLVRLIKYQIVAIPILSRYLWYSFYIFQLLLPLVLLWMAWAIDKPKNQILPPRWWRIMAIMIIILIIVVFTNDLHGLVLHLDLSRSDWAINYGYGIGYYAVLLISFANLITVHAILLKKSLKNPRKKGFIFPLLIFLIFVLYNYKYIIREPLVYQTDLTIVTGVFTMLMFEACIRSGLIPVNTKYIDLFTRSPLKMQIINTDGEIALAASSAAPLNQDLLKEVLASSPEPVLQDDDSLLFANPIPGGFAIWHEDISKLYQLQREIKESTQMLTEANAMLAEEEKLKRFVNEQNAKRQLMEQLEAEIAERIEKLSTMVEKLNSTGYLYNETTEIAISLCYIKRRCNLFFREKELDITPIDSLIVYIDELSEIADYSNVKIVTINELKGSIPIRYATLFYDFFYDVANLAVQSDCPYMIVYIESDEESLTMRLLPSKDVGVLKLDPGLISAIDAVNGSIGTKELEDTVGISISFPKGGVTND